MCICMWAALCVCVSVYAYIHIESLNNLKVHDKLSNSVAVPQQTEELVMYTLHLTLLTYSMEQSPS